LGGNFNDLVGHPGDQGLRKKVQKGRTSVDEVKFWMLIIVLCLLAIAIYIQIIYLWFGEDRIRRYFQLLKKQYKSENK
jgi:hypothetical protein